LADEPHHAGIRALVRDLNRIYRETPALHRLDHESDGFKWLSWQDEAHSVLSYLRRSEDDHAVVLLNFTPVPRRGYRVGVPLPGRYREILCSDSRYYGGSDVGNDVVPTEPTPWMEQPHSIVVTVPPLAGVVLVPG
jgi:1,4-alpha-glucan branching enzyme